MKITLSKAQWQFIGNKTGWIKKAQENNELTKPPTECPHCHLPLEEEKEDGGGVWLGEDKNRVGWSEHHEHCPSCSFRVKYDFSEQAEFKNIKIFDKTKIT